MTMQSDDVADELRVLRNRVLLMGGRVEEMVHLAVRAATEGDTALAQQTRERDRRVNTDQIEIDRLALALLDIRKPTGPELRLVGTAPKFAAELERMGDQATAICRRTLDLNRRAYPGPLHTIAELGETVEDMVHRSIEAFITGDVAEAELVLALDDVADDLYSQAFQTWLARAKAPGADVERAIHVQNVAKSLERIGDHATNIAELVIFVVEGRDVRHRGKRTDER